MIAIDRLKASGLKVPEIARALSVPRQTVGHWDRNRSPPSPRLQAKLIDLAKERGITLLAEDFHPVQDAA